LIVGCSGTSEQTIRAYNSLGRGQHLDLIADGYIIGIEKYNRKQIGAPEPVDSTRFRKLPNPEKDELVSERNKEFTKAIDDPKSMVVTHITSYFSERSYIYNAYSDSLEGKINYEKGYIGLANFQLDLQKQILSATDQNAPYSHIFIMNMGWNNDQFVSIYRYNKIIHNLFKVAKAKGDITFRPLFIGITWPSAWFTIEDSWLKKKVIGHLGSYTNKSNDADEVGYTIANWIINHQLPRIRENVRPKKFPRIIAIGHSMGARILSRAIFSNDHLKNPHENTTDTVDIFIGLQGAFSARRFVAEDSGEGAPYKNYTLLSTRIILTSSENDKANPFAFWSKHVGGKNGLKYMKKHSDIFKVLVWPQDRDDVEMAVRDYSKNLHIITLDVKEIVTGPDAHNDILDTDIAKLIMSCLSQID
jgi:hypothetical protein